MECAVKRLDEAAFNTIPYTHSNRSLSYIVLGIHLFMTRVGYLLILTKFAQFSLSSSLIGLSISMTSSQGPKKVASKNLSLYLGYMEEYISLRINPGPIEMVAIHNALRGAVEL